MKTRETAVRPGASRVLEAYYRLPEGLIRVEAPAERRTEPTFFTFGDATCYGRPVTSARDLSASVDLASQVVSEDGLVRLPFDLNEIIDNLHFERYLDQQSAHGGGGLVRTMYYSVRPMLPVNVRKYLQRMWLSGWDKIPFPRWPLDMTVETIMEQALMLALKASGQKTMPFIWFWPAGAPSCAIMTHDVETKTGLDFCDQLMELDDSCGIKSSFQLVPEGRYHVSQSVLDGLRSRGFEANVHDLNHDGHLFQARDQFLARAAKINEYARQFGARGFRAGAMYRRQDWFDAFELSYDMSVPNAAHLEPQRGGCCTVMPYFIGKMVELPLTTIQDYSLFHIINDYSTTRWKEQIARISARHGLISFITHPDYLIDDRARNVYTELLAHLRDLRASGEVWIALPRDVDAWWRQRSRMTLVQGDEGWRIEGPESHRARVAFATIENDRLVYKVSRTSKALEYSRC